MELTIKQKVDLGILLIALLQQERIGSITSDEMFSRFFADLMHKANELYNNSEDDFLKNWKQFQQEHLDKFKEQVKAAKDSGIPLTDEEIKSRLDMYVDSLDELHWKSIINNIKRKGQEVRWRIGGTKESCESCLTMAALDWMNADNFDSYGLIPQSSNLECTGINCQCYLETRSKVMEETLETLKTDEVGDVEELVGEYQLVCDSEEKRQVRQVYTMANRKNKNRRILPKDALQKAVDEFRPRALAGASLGEHKHPKTAKAADGKEYYTDNALRKAIRIDNIEDVDSGGLVWGTHTVLKTPFGDALWNLYKENKPVGISMRYECGSTYKMVGDEKCEICSPILIHTFDSVENPAVTDSLTHYKLLTDSEQEELVDETTKKLGDNKNNMNAQMKAIFSRLRKAVAACDSEKYNGEKSYLLKLIADSEEAGEDTTEALEGLGKLEGIKITKEASPEGVGFAPDVKEEKNDGAPKDSDEKKLMDSLRAEVEALKTDNEKIKADAILAAKGFNMEDAGPKGAIEAPVTKDAYKIVTMNLVKAMDAIAEEKGCEIKPKLRKKNIEKFVEPFIADLRKKNSTHSIKGLDLAFDSVQNKTVDEVEAELKQGFLNILNARADDATLSAINQVYTVAEAILLQQFQDMEFLSIVSTVGAGTTSGVNTKGWFATGAAGPGKIGAAYKVPVETFAPNIAPLAVGENASIPEFNQQVGWQTYAPTWLRGRTSITADVQAVSEQGFSYDVIARAIYHLAFLLARTDDAAIAQEILTAADEVNAVAVSAETAVLADNSVYSAAGGITVNLNPKKLANAAIAGAASTLGNPVGDAYVVYGANVIGAVRLQCAVATPGASAYCGDGNGLSVIPVVRPRTNINLDVNGAYTTTVSNAITLTAPTAGVMGVFDKTTNSIISLPGTTATFAVDEDNGVLVFASGVTGTTAGIISTTVTASYSYATNIDLFQVNNVTLPTGVTYETYLNGLLTKFDKNAATMGTAPTFMKPNMALMSLQTSTDITPATIFYKLNSPEGSALYPTENYFFERNGINGIRVNTPEFSNKRIVLGRLQATHYAISVNEIVGPFQSRDASGNVIDERQWLAHRLRVIATPQVPNQPVYRSIIVY